MPWAPLDAKVSGRKEIAYVGAVASVLLTSLRAQKEAAVKKKKKAAKSKQVRNLPPKVVNSKSAKRVKGGLSMPGAPEDSFSINFSKYDVEYTPQNPGPSLSDLPTTRKKW